MVWLRMALLVLGLGGSTAAAAAGACAPALDFHLRPLDGQEPVHLCQAHKGQVVLIVNTASKCAFTPQYEGLEAMYARYQARGFSVVGLPSNDFGNQEPGSEKRIKDFCRLTYSVRFPMYEKTHAARAKADPIYQYLGQATGEYPQWNFHKYLLDRQGRVVASFASHIPPDDPKLVQAVERELARD